MKKIVSIVLAALMAASLMATPVFAAEEATVVVEATVLASVIDVTQTLSASITFDPADGSVVSPGYTITSNNNCPLTVSINSIALNGSADYALVGPTAKTWDELKKDDKFMAIGIKLDETVSNSTFTAALAETLWSTDASSTEFGEIEAKGTVTVNFDAKHSYSVDAQRTIYIDVVVSIALA